MFYIELPLEQVCCKKRQKLVPDLPVTGLGNKGPLKVLNGTKLILDDLGKNLTHLEPVWNPSGPL